MRTLLAFTAALSLAVPAAVTGGCTTREVYVVGGPSGPGDEAGGFVGPGSLDPFYEPLAQHGDWWWSDRWGWVWSPAVGPGWRPYTVGNWLWTDDGWFWSSAEPFGWATFHYGRWIWLDDAGWVWIPGRVWGPSWVVWRTGPGFIGWGPLPPGGYVSVERAYGPWGWVLVEERYFLSPVHTVVLPPARNPTVLPSTRVIHRPEQERDERAVSRALDRETVERATGVPVRPTRVLHDERERRQEDGPDTVVVPRARELERARPDVSDAPGLPGPRGTLTPARDPRDLEERPLRAPNDDDVERDTQEERQRLLDIHARERKAPPPDTRPDDLERRQKQELDTVERDKVRKKDTTTKKRTTPRKVPKAKPR